MDVSHLRSILSGIGLSNAIITDDSIRIADAIYQAGFNEAKARAAAACEAPHFKIVVRNECVRRAAKIRALTAE